MSGWTVKGKSAKGWPMDVCGIWLLTTKRKSCSGCLHPDTLMTDTSWRTNTSGSNSPTNSLHIKGTYLSVGSDFASFAHLKSFAYLCSEHWEGCHVSARTEAVPLWLINLLKPCIYGLFFKQTQNVSWPHEGQRSLCGQPRLPKAADFIR